MYDAPAFFDLGDYPYAGVFADTEYVWNALAVLREYIDGRVRRLPDGYAFAPGVPLSEPLVFHEGRTLSARECTIVYGNTLQGGLVVYCENERLQGASVVMAGAVLQGGRIELGKGVLVEPGAMIREPAIIGDRTEIRHGAYLRGYCLVGRRCVVGHATEVKHSIFLDDAKAGHFAYLGDSILGGGANLGAGTKMANLRFLPGEVKVRTPEGILNSGLQKFGAVLGDRAQTGCNSVTNPGTLIGRGGFLMPNTTAPSGYHQPGSVIR
jgi:bifunctional N-acetylglucosamine-1-phosphate-uridyltransferase/glucosamine-1-phosphate-acetyltransferase GlmU-like protein